MIGAHDINARNVCIDAQWHLNPLHLLAILRVAQYLVGRDDASLDDVVIMVDVMQKQIECLDPLLEASLQFLPLSSSENARDNIKRDGALGAIGVAIDCKCDADAPENQFGFLAPCGDEMRRLLRKPMCKALIVLSRCKGIDINGIKRDCARLKHFVKNLVKAICLGG